MISKIQINGQDFTNDVGGLDEFKVSYALNDSTKTVNIGISNALIFIGDAFEYLESIFFDGTEEGRRRTEVITLTEDCCDVVYEFTIRGDLLEYCPEECEIRTQSFADSEDLQLYDLMRTTPLNSGNTDVSKLVPQMRVCKDSGAVAVFFFVVLASIIAFIELVTNTVAILTGFDPIEFDTFKADHYGCNAFVSLFSVNDLLETSIGNIGGSFSSSILQQGDYANMYILHRDEAYIDKYCRATDRPALIIDSITNFLASISIVFNADYRIKNGVVRFERRDFFIASNPVLVNISEVESETICYSFTDSPNYASGKFSFTKDGLDPVSNSAYLNYFDRVEWNEPFDRLQVGVLDVNVPFGTVAFTQDEFNNSVIDNARPAGLLKLDDKSNRTRELSKLIVLKPQDTVNDPDWCDARAVVCPNAVTGFNDYNWPLYFKEDYQKQELYQRFYSIENPRAVKNSIYSIDTFSFIADCEKMQLVIDNGVDLNIITPFGVGIAESIELDFTSSLITLNNIEIFK